MATRRPAALEPASSTSLNALPPDPPLKRRKLSESNGGDLQKPAAVSSASHPSHSSPGSVFGAPFTIHDADAPDSASARFVPVTLVPRSRLPLSWFNPCPSPPPSRSHTPLGGQGGGQGRGCGKGQGGQGGSPIQFGRLFVARIPMLEEQLGGSVGGDVVLAAKRVESWRKEKEADCEGEGLYVIERVKAGVYAIIALGAWVCEGDLLVAGKRWRAQTAGAGAGADAGAPESKPAADDWLERARIPGGLEMTPGKRNQAWRDVELAFRAQGKNVAPGLPADGLGAQSEQSGAQKAADQNASSGVEQGSARRPQSLEEMFDAIRNQYLETLYISKSSVAYFVKGPLSRARTAFQAEDATLHLSRLVLFYRDCVLPMKKMDHKYRETLPQTIRSITADSSDEDKALPKPKRRKHKKIGKNGLYYEEESFIERWWNDREPAGPEVSIQEETKGLVGDLRVRETELQLLLILETISIETTMPPNPLENGSEKRKKKPQDLNLLLELLVDRLCIWNTITDKIPQSDTEATKNQANVAPDDRLRDFCAEIIIPFYLSRLPDQCKTISKKLGAHILIEPKRIKQPSQPGTAVKRSRPRVPRPQHSLQRVLTDERAAVAARRTSSRTPTPALMRSSSTSNLRDVVDETGVSQGDYGSAGGNNHGNGVLQPPKRDKVEMDLDAAARVHQDKIRKRNRILDQKRELDAAIAALRRPNRELAVRDLAAEVDERHQAQTQTGNARGRKQRNPVRNPFATGSSSSSTTMMGADKTAAGVQVMATPTKGQSHRRRDVFALPADNGGYDHDPPLPPVFQQPLSRRLGLMHQLRSPAATSSSPVAVPSSVSRLSMRPPPPPQMGGLHPDLNETPSKPRPQPPLGTEARSVLAKPQSQITTPVRSRKHVNVDTMDAHSGRSHIFDYDDEDDGDGPTILSTPVKGGRYTDVMSGSRITTPVIDTAAVRARAKVKDRMALYEDGCEEEAGQVTGVVDGSVRAVETGSPNTPAPVPATPRRPDSEPQARPGPESQSIYAQLGWDDGYDAEF